MKVEGISVDIPGITYEHTDTKNLPEISPNVITDIGRLYFNPKSVCSPNNQCYTGLKLSSENIRGTLWKNVIKDYRFFQSDFDLLKDRLAIYEQLKNNLTNISFRLTTSQIRKYDFNASVELVWPRLMLESIKFPVLQVGHEVLKAVPVTNPSDELVVVHYVLHESSLHGDDLSQISPKALSSCPDCILNSHSNVFSFKNDKKQKYSEHINPRSSINMALAFSAQEPGTYSTVLYIRNNLTIVEGVWVTAKAVQPLFKFGNRKPGSSTPLLFEITEKHLRDCDKESIDNVGIVVPSAKRTFTARNVGEVPIRIEEMKINDHPCEGFGFKVLDCTPFDLAPNASKKIEIAFTPDFTLARVQQTLILETSIGIPVNYTLLSTIPPHALGPCGRALLRPHWEAKIKHLALTVLCIVFVIIFVGVFLESDRILKDHVTNMSKVKGPAQPILDLRQIGKMKPSQDDSSTIHHNNTKADSWSSSKKKNGETKRSNWTTDLTNKLKTQVAEMCSSSKKSSNVTRRSITPPSNKSTESNKKRNSNINNNVDIDSSASSTAEDCSFHSESSSVSSTASSTSSLASGTQSNNNSDSKQKANKLAVKKTRSLPGSCNESKDENAATKPKISKSNGNQNNSKNRNSYTGVVPTSSSPVMNQNAGEPSSPDTKKVNINFITIYY